MRTPLLAALAVLAAAALAPPAAEAQEKLVVIGSGKPEAGSGSIAIDVSEARGAFRGLRLNQRIGTVEIKRVEVVFADGTRHAHDREFRLLQGERTRSLWPEKQGDSFIDAVNLTIVPPAATAVIDILGVQTRAGAGKQRPAPSGEVAAASPPPRPVAAPRPGPPGDVLFGHGNVEFGGSDRDVIQVGDRLGKFERIRLSVLDNPIRIETLTVNYGDGAAETFAVDAVVKPNARTGWFELRSAGFIRDIELVYRAPPKVKGKARVEVTGEYARDWLAAAGEGRTHNEGWVLLGAQTAGFAGFDRDTIIVGRNEGGFSRLRVDVEDRAITLREIRVKYTDGPDEVFTMRERVDPGKPYGPLELRAGKGRIDAIEARYRSRYDIQKGLANAVDGTPAVVRIWAHH